MSDISSAAASGSELETLTALRDRLAWQIDVSDSARDVAALSARLVDVIERIAAIKPLKTSKADELAKKRAQRQGTPAIGGADSADSDVPACKDNGGG